MNDFLNKNNIYSISLNIARPKYAYVRYIYFYSYKSSNIVRIWLSKINIGEKTRHNIRANTIFFFVVTKENFTIILECNHWFSLNLPRVFQQNSLLVKIILLCNLLKIQKLPIGI